MAPSGTPLRRPQILFVDDEPHVLSGLRRSLWAVHDRWDLHWADGAAAALEVMARSAVDVVVTDMRMPGMDGGALLEQVRLRHPGAVRIVLSGHADHAAIIAAAGPTQQFLSKPCEPAQLLQTLELAVATHALLDDSSELQSLLGGIENLPKPPGIYTELTHLMTEPGTGLADVAHVVERDVSTSAEVLKLINSSFFGLPNEVTTVHRAVSLLGMEMITALVLAGNAFSPSTDLPADLDAGRLAEEGRVAAQRTRLISDCEGWTSAVGNRLALAALLQRLGLLVLAADNPAGWARYRDSDGTARRQRETDAFGCTVGRASAYLLGLWGFDPTVVKTLAELPVDLVDSSARDASSPAAQAVAYACLSPQVAHSLRADPSRGQGDETFLTTERLGRWRQLSA